MSHSNSSRYPRGSQMALIRSWMSMVVRTCTCPIREFLVSASMVDQFRYILFRCRRASRVTSAKSFQNCGPKMSYVSAISGLSGILILLVVVLFLRATQRVGQMREGEHQRRRLLIDNTQPRKFHENVSNNLREHLICVFVHLVLYGFERDLEILNAHVNGRLGCTALENPIHRNIVRRLRDAAAPARRNVGFQERREFSGALLLPVVLQLCYRNAEKPEGRANALAQRQVDILECQVLVLNRIS